MVVPGGHQHDAVAQANVFGALGTCRQEYFRRGSVGVLFEKMMLDRPDSVYAQLIGKFDLVQRFLEQAKLRIFVPRPG